MILSILIYGIFAGVNVYDTFIKGAKRGFWTVVRLMPKESCNCFSDGRIEPGG